MSKVQLHRKVTLSCVQDVSDYVGSIAQANEEVWKYALPELGKAVDSIAVGLDGAHILMRKDGWRESMVSNISLYGMEGRTSTYTVGILEVTSQYYREVTHLTQGYFKR